MIETNGLIQLPPVSTRCTNPDTLRLLAEQLVASAEAVVDPLPEPERVEAQAETERKPALPKYVLQKRIDIRFRDWLMVQVNQPKRIARWLSWWIALPWRAVIFLNVVLSPKIPPDATYEDTAGESFTGTEVIENRKKICRECDQRYAFVHLDGSVTFHCSACKCPPTGWSENDYRAEFSGFHCPLRKHPGPYPNDGQAGALKGLGYEENAVLSAVGGGCTGCGCGKK